MRIPLASATLAAALAAATGCSGMSKSRKTPFWEVPARRHPPTTEVELRLFPEHPRLVFRPAADRGHGRTFQEVRKLYRTDKRFRVIFDKARKVAVGRQHPAMLAACWIVTGEEKFARAAIDRMVAGKLGKSGEPYYSNVWKHALAYDWLYDHPALTAEEKKVIVAKMVARLKTELADLDDEGQALWHGRNQQANGCMIAALAVGDLPGGAKLLRRAAAHYIESLRALQYSEGWPEGASYWIYNRAGPYAMAADCVMTALGVEHIGGIPIREVMRRIGLWQLYQFAPNQVFEPYGDSSGSLRLGSTGWWELTTDYYARLSRDPGLMAGGDYLRNRSPVAYGRRPYYWHVALTYDPAVRPKKGYDPARPELWMRRHLPQAELFGRDSMGVAFLRGKWGDSEETYASFKAGDYQAHHDHYDAGHFSIQRGGLLAPQTGLYGPGGYFGEHRLGYTAQTVSANSLLVLAPGEKSAYLAAHKKVKWSALSGGQRVIRPTGFHCVGFEHYRRQQKSGPHLERATVTQFESVPAEYDYIAADITAAYNSTRWAEPGNRAKVRLVTRQFLYLRRHGAFAVYDRVETTNAKYLPKFLLHHLAKPRTKSEKLLAGNGPDDGILATADRLLTSTHKRGKLFHAVMLPREARALKIGGPNYNCYVESDGDQSNGFTGKNLPGGNPLKPRSAAQLGLWRTEVEPVTSSKSTRFLNLLFVRPLSQRKLETSFSPVEAGRNAHAARVGDTICVFAQGTGPLKTVKLQLARAAARCLLLNAAPGRSYSVGRRRFKASREGVLRLQKLPAGLTEIRAR